MLSTPWSEALGSSPDTIKAWQCDFRKILSLFLDIIQTPCYGLQGLPASPELIFGHFTFLPTLFLPFWPLTVHETWWVICTCCTHCLTLHNDTCIFKLQLEDTSSEKSPLSQTQESQPCIYMEKNIYNSKRYTFPSVHWSTICNKTLEANSTPINKWVDKESVVHTLMEYYLSHKK